MEISTWMIVTVCSLVFAASFVDSIAGGGGLISLPAYMLVGLPTSFAAGTNKLSACVGTLTAAFRFARGHKLVWRTALLAAVGALPGAYAGAWVMQLLPAQTSRIIILVMLPVSAVIIVLRDRLPRIRPLSHGCAGVVSALIGLALGFYDGLVGPGTGTFLIIAFSMLLGMDEVVASGTAKIVNLGSNVAALAAMLLGGHVVFALGIPAAACSIIGGYVGSGLAIKRGAKFVRLAMLVVLALLLIKLIYDTVVM